MSFSASEQVANNLVNSNNDNDQISNNKIKDRYQDQSPNKFTKTEKKESFQHSSPYRQHAGLEYEDYSAARSYMDYYIVQSKKQDESIEYLTSELHGAKTKINQQHSHLKVQEAENIRLNSENLLLHDERNSLAHSNNNLVDELKKTEAELTIVRQDCIIQRDRHMDLENLKNQELHHLNFESEQQRKQLVAEIDSRNQQISNLNNQIDKERRQNINDIDNIKRNHQNEVDNHIKQNLLQKQQNDNLNAQLKQTQFDLSKALADLENKNKDLDILNYTASKDRKQLIEEIDNLKKKNIFDIEALSSQNLALKHQINDLQNLLKNSQTNESIQNLENKKLNEKLDFQNRLLNDQQLKHIQEHNLSEELNQRKQQELRAQSEYEKSRLAQEIGSLNLKLENQRRDVQDTKIQKSVIQSQLIVTEKQARDQSFEAEFWRERAGNIEKESSLEKERNHHFVQVLKSSHDKEMIVKELEKDNLRKVIQHKDQEVLSSRYNYSQAVTELTKAEREKRAKEMESEFFKRRADQIEIEKNIQLQTREDLHRRECDTVKRTLSAEKEQLSQQLAKSEYEKRNKQIESEINKRRADETERQKLIELAQKEEVHRREFYNVQQSLTAEKSYLMNQLSKTEQEKRNKEIESQLYKKRAEDIERSKYAELTVRESIHHREVQQVRRSLSEEKELLERELQKKNLEANDWRNNYHRIYSVLRRPYN